MADLEYLIGGLNLCAERLGFAGSDPYGAAHKFVARAQGDKVSIYVSEGKGHKDVVSKFSLSPGGIVGGGSCYLDVKGRLTINDFSGSYNAIPKEAAQKFAELIKPEIEKLGMKVNDVAVNPSNLGLHSFWNKYGFASNPSCSKPEEDVSW